MSLFHNPATPLPAAGAVGAAAAAPAPASAAISTPALLSAMLKTSAKISDLFLSPGKPPLVEVNGKLAPAGPRTLNADDTRRIAADLIADNQHALATLR
jgi:Tfp pilus assembly ATPase PilU